MVLFSCLAVYASQSSFGPDECCFNIYNQNKPLPRKKVVSYRWINAGCPKPAVIFKMRSNAELCVSPSQEWAQKIIKNLENKKETAVATPSPNIHSTMWLVLCKWISISQMFWLWMISILSFFLCFFWPCSISVGFSLFTDLSNVNSLNVWSCITSYIQADMD